MEAQSTTGHVVGEYYLQGVMETASGFKIDADHQFEFFFSQGALDRFGKGTWSVNGDCIEFNSPPRTTQDFVLVHSAKQQRDVIMLQIPEKNSGLGRYVTATIKGGGALQEKQANEEGVIQFAPQPIDSIELVFMFCPEKKYIFTVTKEYSGHNDFTFRFEPSIMEIFFNNFQLQVQAHQLTGANPVLDGKTFVYKKPTRPISKGEK